MQLTLQPDVPLELKLIERIGAGDGLIEQFEMTGPTSQMQMLENVCEDAVLSDLNASESKPLLQIRGPLSPLAELTLPAEAREAAGIPLEAHYFAFAYPADYRWTKEIDMTDDVGWHSLEKKLEILNLAEEMWGFFLLVGGFCYFNANKEVIRANALTLVPSENVMNFDGPFQPAREAIEALQDCGRMVNITLDALEDAGFKAFAWVFPSEIIGGFSVCAEESYELGAFVYLMKNAPPALFKLVPHTDEQVEQWKKSIAISDLVQDPTQVTEVGKAILKRMNTINQKNVREEKLMEQGEPPEPWLSCNLHLLGDSATDLLCVPNPNNQFQRKLVPTKLQILGETEQLSHGRC